MENKQRVMKRSIAVSDNSFDILRLFAALQIAITHYLNLSMLTYGKDWPGDGVLWVGKRILTLFPGLIILLTISGFLMGETLNRVRDRRTFVWKRFRRIYPGLWINMLFIAAELFCLLGREKIPVEQLIRWALVQGSGAAYTPDFFQGVATGSLNGTLWAIMVELQLYFLIFIFWKGILRWSRRVWSAGLVLTTALNLMCWFVEEKNLLPEGAQKLLQRSFLPYLLWFYLGLYLWNYRDKILPVLAERWPVLLLGYTVYKACWQEFQWNVPGYYADFITGILLPVTVLACAYGWRRHRLKADLSYGIFLYHWPLINLIFFLDLPQTCSHIPLFLGYAAGFLMLGAMSWYGIERRMVGSRGISHPQR